MKSAFVAMFVSVALAVPAVSFAQSNVSTQAVQTETSQSTSVGGVADGSSAAGSADHAKFGSRVAGFLRHANGSNSSNGNQCVGPVSYCNVFFGS